MPDSRNSLGALDRLEVGGRSVDYFRISAVDGTDRLPFSLKVLLENLLRTEDGVNVTPEQIAALANWNPAAEPDTEIQFSPARVVMQDFTGVPAVVDLATMREAVRDLGGDPARVNPLAPAELVIDHSVIADLFGTPDAFERNVELEYSRNRERYQFLRWGQTAFDQFKVVPPGTGIVHQVNIEYLARVVFEHQGVAYPDTLVGTDSHTTMVNGLGVLGWGVGGIEAEAAMLGQPVSMLIPKVVGFKLTGELPDGSTATDLVLTITEMLRRHGVVGKFVEFYGSGVPAVPVANRATIGNMSPEYGSTCAIFPSTTRRSTTFASPVARTIRLRSSRLTRRRTRCGMTPTRSRRTPRHSSWISRPSNRPSPDPNGRRIGWHSPPRKRPSARHLPISPTVIRSGTRSTRRSTRASPPRIRRRPPTMCSRCRRRLRAPMAASPRPLR